MIDRDRVKELLKKIRWQSGKTVALLEGPYRHRIIILCSEYGRHRAVFTDGQEHPYFAYLELCTGNGRWIQEGAGVVPILPDGRFLMVVEQRPAQSAFLNRPTIALVEGAPLNLASFGHHSSLEFPGGAVEPEVEILQAGFLRELKQETGVERQTALFYQRCRPIYAYGSDIAVQQFVGVVFLQGLAYELKMKEDGGDLWVLALTREDIVWNIRSGVIASGQAALLEWDFYREVEEARKNPSLEKELILSGYMTKREVKIL